MSMESKWRRLAENAHFFLDCYERAIETLLDKYPEGSPQSEVLYEVLELYAEYENELEP